MVAASIDAAANALAAGAYNDTVTFTNTTNGTWQHVPAPSLPHSDQPGRSRGHAGRRPHVYRGRSAVRSLRRARPTRSRTREARPSTGRARISSRGRPCPPRPGTSAAGATATVTVSINAAANALTAGSYTDLATFTNTTNGSGNTNRAIVLTVTSQGVLAVTPAGGLTSTGPVGGPFTPSSQAYTLQNTGGAALNWTCAKVQAWTTLSLASGTLAVGATATVTVSINTAANALAAGTYNDTVTFTNTTNGSGNATRPVALTVTAARRVLAVTPAGRPSSPRDRSAVRSHRPARPTRSRTRGGRRSTGRPRRRKPGRRSTCSPEPSPPAVR